MASWKRLGEDSLGPRGGWSFLFSNEAAAKFKFDELLASDTLLLGRVTYQIFAAAWPSRSVNAGLSGCRFYMDVTLRKVE